MYTVVTGCAGFIGYHVVLKLLKSQPKIKIIGIDNINSYYSVKLKQSRLSILNNYSNFQFMKIDLINSNILFKNLKDKKINYIIHLAAQPGVRYSFTNPEKYIKSNIIAFNNIMELCRIRNIEHIFFASSSSVYGDQKKFPIKENVKLQPVSFYGVTKLINEEIAKSYSLNFNIHSTALRFFTVYGPYGRPDMALYKFVNLINNNKEISVYNNGNHYRDFSYIDDIVNALIKIIRFRLKKKKRDKKSYYMCFNLANGKSKKLKLFIDEIQKNLKKKAKVKNINFQQGDVFKTHADISNLKKFTNYKSKYDIKKGIKNFVGWYKSYHKTN